MLAEHDCERVEVWARDKLVCAVLRKPDDPPDRDVWGRRPSTVRLRTVSDLERELRRAYAVWRHAHDY
jgi:hypothetical protein